MDKKFIYTFSEEELYARLIKHTKDLGMSSKLQGEGFLYINEQVI